MSYREILIKNIRSPRGVFNPERRIIAYNETPSRVPQKLEGYHGVMFGLYMICILGLLPIIVLLLMTHYFFLWKLGYVKDKLLDFTYSL